MATEIKPKFSASAALTITLASLASSTSGVGRQSTLVDNSTTRYRRVRIHYRITTGTSPAATRLYFYRIRGDDPASSNIRTDNAGATDAAFTTVTAELLHVATVSTANDTAYRGDFLLEDPGPEWGIAVVQDTTVNLNATGGNHVIRYVGETDEAV